MPTLRVGRPELSVLDWNDPLLLRGRCDPLCDVRAEIAGGRYDSSTGLMGDHRRFAARLRHVRGVRFVALHVRTWRGTGLTRTVRVR